MKSGFVVRAAIGLLIAGSASGRRLRAGRRREIVGQPIQVTTNGVTNTIYLDPGGSARMLTPGGNTVPATWQVANGQLCLNNGAAQECWPYSAPFQASQPVTLTSSCNATSTWLAQATNSRRLRAGSPNAAARPALPISGFDRGRAYGVAMYCSCSASSDGSCVRSRWSGVTDT